MNSKILRFIPFLIFGFLISCGGKSGSPTMIPWMAALMGGGETATGGLSVVDSNGEALPVIIEESIQEVPTAGETIIHGKISPVQCFENGLSQPCSQDQNLDLSKIEVHLVSANGTIVEKTTLSSDGDFQFSIPDLKNGNYRVLINTGHGLNYAFEDFNFTFNPTLSGPNQINLDPIEASRYYLSSGPAYISGGVNTNGFKDQNGNVVVPMGSLSGVKVQLTGSNGDILQETFTDSNGKYEFQIGDLSNGNYGIVVKGSELQTSGRFFTDEVSGFRFIFSGNDPVLTTNVELSSIGIKFVPSPTAPLQLSEWSIRNSANPGMELGGFQVILKDTQNNTIASTSTDSSGKFSFGPTLPEGIYTIEIKKEGFFDAVTSFSFTPNYAGSSTTVNQPSQISLVPKPSNITGKVTGPGGIPSRIEGASINFRPSNNQAPSSLLYLTMGTDDRLKNLANLWVREACSSIPSCLNACGAGGFAASCIVANQGSGPWIYSTYQNKVYEVKADNQTVFFTAVAGKWEYYISAPGFDSTTPQNITLNGGDVTVNPFNLTPSQHRGAIRGQTLVLDTLSSGLRNSYGGPMTGFTQNPGLLGLFSILLGNTTTNSQPVAHITMTGANGEYNFDGNSRVVLLPPLSQLCSSQILVAQIGATGTLTESTQPTCSSSGDALRVAYAISQFQSAERLSTSSIVGTEIDTSPIYVHNSNYTFRQGSYSILFVDPLKHLSASSQKAEINQTLVPNFGDALNLVSTILHLPRRTISGTLTDAISSAAIGGATISLGSDTNPDPNLVDFSQNVTRDQDTIPGNIPRLDPSTGSRSDIPVPDVTTDANGNYTIPNVNPGNYILRVTKSGFDTIMIPITVSSSGTGTVANGQIIQAGARGDLSGRVIFAGGALFNHSYNLELVHPTSGNRPTAPVNPTSLSVGTSNFSSSPNYRIYNINSGQWKLKFTSAGYVPVEGLVNIQGNTVTNFDIITMIPGSQAPANISGILFNAFNNLRISSPLTLSLRPGINNRTGSLALNGNNQTILPITSGSDGSYMISNVPAGNYTLEVSGAGFSTTFQTVISAGASSGGQNIFVSPTLDSGEVRVVLSWGQYPQDLDSHLEYGDSTCLDGGKKCQVVWNDTSKLGGDLTLDVDVTTGFGPETVTIKGSAWSTPRRGYSVYKWSSELTHSIFTSGATVKVFKSSGLVRTFNPGSSQVSRWWQIFCLDNERNIIDAGQPGCSTSDFFNAIRN